MFSGHDQHWQQPMPQLNDPVLDAIKRHLTIGWRIGFEPLSRRFARLAIYIKKRMELKLNGYHHFCQDPGKDFVEVVLKRKNGPNECPLGVILLSDMKRALRALFRRIRQWRSVDFALIDFIYHYRYRGVWFVPDSTDGSDDSDCLWLGQPLVDDLLDALLAESRLTTGTGIRRFKCNQVEKLNQRRLAVVLQRASANLRRLAIGLPFESPERNPPLPFLVEAIGACQQLRQLLIGSYAHLEQIPPAFFSMLLALPHLTGLRLGDYLLPSTTVHPHTLSIHGHWLPFVSQLAFRQTSMKAPPTEQPPLLKRMQCLTFDSVHPETFFSTVPTIIAEMRRPTRIIIERHFIYWTIVWRDWLPMVHSMAASILVDGRGLKLISPEVFAAGVGSLPAHVQASLILPDLNTAPVVEDDHYSELLKFGFGNGGELIVQRKNLPN